MLQDILIALMALIITGLSIYFDDSFIKIRYYLLLFALFLFMLTSVKACDDELDKNYLEAALAALVQPSEGDYEKINRDLTKALRKHGYSGCEYHVHSADGAACFLFSDDGATRTATLVLDKADVGKLFTNIIKEEGDNALVDFVETLISAALSHFTDESDDNNTALVDNLIKKSYEATPEDSNLEFLNKVALVGQLTHHSCYKNYPKNYEYGQDFGVILEFDHLEKVQLSIGELIELNDPASPKLFLTLERAFIDKFESRGKVSNKCQKRHPSP
jgi:hypothetical protein